jgi:hypothetical protein
MLAETRTAIEQALIAQLEQHAFGFVLYVVDDTGSVSQVSNLRMDEIYEMLRAQVLSYEADHAGAGHA